MTEQVALPPWIAPEPPAIGSHGSSYLVDQLAIGVQPPPGVFDAPQGAPKEPVRGESRPFALPGAA